MTLSMGYDTMLRKRVALLDGLTHTQAVCCAASPIEPSSVPFETAHFWCGAQLTGGDGEGDEEDSWPVVLLYSILRAGRREGLSLY